MTSVSSGLLTKESSGSVAGLLGDDGIVDWPGAESRANTRNGVDRERLCESNRNFRDDVQKRKE